MPPKRETAAVGEVGEIFSNKAALEMVQNPAADVKLSQTAQRTKGEQPPSIIGDHNSPYVQNDKRKLKEDSQYAFYFLMLKNGVPKHAVVQKMKQDGVDPKLLDLGPDGVSPNSIRRTYWARDGTLRYQWVPKLHSSQKELSAIIYFDTDLIYPEERVYMVDKKWLDSWLMFAVKGTRVPPMITNERLVNAKSRRPKKHLEYNTHWRPVNYKIWRYLLDKYGGGPAISIVYEGNDILEGKKAVAAWASGLRLRHDPEVHPVGTDGLEEFADEEPETDEIIAQKMNEMKKAAEKAQAERLAKTLNIPGRAGGDLDPFEKSMMGMPEPSQEQKETSLLIGIDPIAINRTPTNQRSIEERQDAAARIPAKQLVGKIVFIETLGMARVLRFLKVSRAEAVKGMNSKHTIQPISQGGLGENLERMDVLLRRAKPKGFNKGLVFRICDESEIPSNVRRELREEQERVEQARQNKAFLYASDEQAYAETPGSMNEGNSAGMEPEAIGDEVQDESSRKMSRTSKIMRRASSKQREKDSSGELVTEVDSLLSSNSVEPTPEKKRGLAKFSSVRAASSASQQEENTTASTSEIRDSWRIGVSSKIEANGGATSDEAVSDAEEVRTEEQPESTTSPKNLVPSRPSFMSNMREAHSNLSSTLSNSFSFISPATRSTDGSEENDPRNSSGSYAPINPQDPPEDQAADIRPDTLVGKTVDIQGLGIGRVISFLKVDKRQALLGKHSLHVIDIQGDTQRLELRRRKNGKFTSGLTFKVVEESDSSSSSQGEGDGKPAKKGSVWP